MLKIYKNVSSVIFSVLLFIGVISYIIFPELFYNNKINYGACLNAISSGVVYSIEFDEDSDFSIITLRGADGDRKSVV